MFTEARTKLTLYYLLIIMVISIFFSLIIYRGATSELHRIETAQRLRRPSGVVNVIEPEIIAETEKRVAFSLVYINLVILLASGIGGYFLAGKTLDPIKKMVGEQKEFISNASHELRTPLTSLMTEIEVALRDKKLTLKDARQMLASNLDDVKKMTSLSNYLLELNKFQNGNNITFSKIDLAEVVRSAVGKKKVKLTLQKSMVNGNADALIQLTSILVDNALKYSKLQDKVEVKVMGKSLEVKDSGMGIAKEDLPHIFDRFYRADKSRGKDGYGLGLSIAKQIAQLHGAKIIVNSKVGIGTSFKVIFS